MNPPSSTVESDSETTTHSNFTANSKKLIITLAACPVALFFAVAFWPDQALKDDSDLIPNIRQPTYSPSNPATRLENGLTIQFTDRQKTTLKSILNQRVDFRWAEITPIFAYYETEIWEPSTRSAKKGWQFQIDFEGPSKYPYFDTLRNGATLIKTKGQFLLAHQKYDDAIKEALVLLQLGKRIEEGCGTFIHQLIGLATIRMGQNLLVQILQKDSISAEKLEMLQAKLHDLKLDPANFSDSYRVEYQIRKNNCEMLAESEDGIEVVLGFPKDSKAPVRLFYQKNRTTNQIANAMRVAIIDINPTPIGTKFEDEVFQKYREKNKYLNLLSPNSIGNALLGKLILPSMATSHGSTCASHQLIDLYIAAALFSKFEKRSIASLSELVPN